MPEFTVKEVRLPELHLPEIKRDEIVRALSGIHVPEVDLKVERARRPAGFDLAALRSGRRTLSGIDLGKLAAAAIAAARLARPASSRSRWSPFPRSPFRRSRWSAVSRSRDSVVAVIRPAPQRSRRRIIAVVIALTAAAGWMMFRRPAVRSRLDRVVADVRRRLVAMRRRPGEDIDLETGEPVSVTTTKAAPVTGAETVTAQAEAEIIEPVSEPA